MEHWLLRRYGSRAPASDDEMTVLSSKGTDVPSPDDIMRAYSNVKSTDVRCSPTGGTM